VKEMKISLIQRELFGEIFAVKRVEIEGTEEAV
jgi:hypothetical protein